MEDWKNSQGLWRWVLVRRKQEPVMAAELLWKEIGHGHFNGENMKKTGLWSGNILKDS